MKRWFFAMGALLLLGAGGIWTDAASQDLNGYVRALSLDLRGVVPTADELRSIEADGEMTEARLTEWLYSAEFEEQVIEHHRSLVWNNLAFNLLNSRRLAQRSGIYWVNQRARFLRGSIGVHCGDFEAEVDEWNRPLNPTQNEDGTYSEGYVMVNPYWAMDTEVKVCAFDAQLTTVSANGIDCSSQSARVEPDCGCGPNLQWCMTRAIETEIKDGLVSDLNERVRMMLQTDGSYSDLLGGNTMFINGPMVHFFQYIAPFNENDYESPVPISELSNIDYNDKTWTEITLDEHHNGIFTAPGWLLRHQTNRGRANRFYSGFLCKDFIPASNEISGLSSQETPSPDLQVREGCLECHARLEPWAAYWGRWDEASMVYRSAEEFPAYLEECAQCAQFGTNCSDFCDDNYLIEQTHIDEGPYMGWLAPFAFLTEDDQGNPDLGPSGWVDDSIASRELTECATRRAAQWLLNWSEEDDVALEQWSGHFQTDLSYRDLVKRITTSSQYWEANQ